MLLYIVVQMLAELDPVIFVCPYGVLSGWGDIRYIRAAACSFGRRYLIEDLGGVRGEHLQPDCGYTQIMHRFS